MSLSVSSQFPSNGSNQIHIPALSVDGLSTPVVLSPGPQKPWAPRPPEAALHRAQPRPMISSTPGGSEEKPDLHWLWNASLKTRRHEKFRLHRLTLFGRCDGLCGPFTGGRVHSQGSVRPSADSYTFQQVGICALSSFHLPVSFIALYSNTMTAGFRENQMLLSTWTRHEDINGN